MPPVITWDGLVVPCCFDKDAQHQLGDLKGKSFKEIWHNKEYVHFRKPDIPESAEILIFAPIAAKEQKFGAD